MSHQLDFGGVVRQRVDGSPFSSKQPTLTTPGYAARAPHALPSASTIYPHRTFSAATGYQAKLGVISRVPSRRVSPRHRVPSSVCLLSVPEV